MTEPLDVLIVTKLESLASDFQNMIADSGIPVNRIIIENSKPLGPARERAIQKVETKKFVWLDDDVWLPKNWYQSLMEYWDNDNIGWLEGLALPTTPKWYADWTNYSYQKHKHEIKNLKPNERSFNCCAVVVADALKDWHYPAGEYQGFGSEDLMMSNHVSQKGYNRLRVPIVAEHRINYGEGNSIWKHIREGTKSLGSLPEYHSPSKAFRYAISCFGSGCIASVKQRNMSILPNATKWAFYWFRDMMF
ncbi:MAG: glycosyltransferase [Nitrososphaerota archaeon]|nr:glycosyltransferase [Nitrososphaerota archaeon]